MSGYEKEQENLAKLHAEFLTDFEPEFEPDDDDTSLEDDFEERQNHDTDMEEDIEEDSHQILNAPQIPHRVPYFIGKDGKTKWRKHVEKQRVRTRAENIIKVKISGVKGEARHKASVLDIWHCFFTEEILLKIVDNTNIFIEMCFYDQSNRTAKKCDILELRALLGLLYIAGVSKNNHRNAADLFRTNGSSPEIFRLTMSLARFKFLLRHIRFDDKRTRLERQTYDKLAAIRDVFDSFNSNLPKHFSLSAYTTVDEKLEAFRGRCSFRVYMPNKPNKYGIKIYALTDAKFPYTANLEVYVGQQRPGPYKVDTSNLSLVPRLCNPISGSHRNVTMDNFFTSINLAELLLNEHQLTILGTIRKNKKELPFEITAPKRPEKTSMFAFQEKFTIVSYIPRKNKNVILISTMHHDDLLDPTTGKPHMIIDYNKTKGGVDLVDKMCAAYNCARPTRRWPMVIFYSMMNVSGINSYIINKYKSDIIDETPRRFFLETLGMELVHDHMRRRFFNKRIPRSIRSRIKDICQIEEQAIPAPNPQPDRRGRCFYCSRQKNRPTKYSCQKCHKYICLEHVVCMCRDCLQDENSDGSGED